MFFLYRRTLGLTASIQLSVVSVDINSFLWSNWVIGDLVSDMLKCIRMFQRTFKLASEHWIGSLYSIRLKSIPTAQLTTTILIYRLHGTAFPKNISYSFNLSNERSKPIRRQGHDPRSLPISQTSHLSCDSTISIWAEMGARLNRPPSVSTRLHPIDDLMKNGLRTKKYFGAIKNRCVKG